MTLWIIWGCATVVLLGWGLLFWWRVRRSPKSGVRSPEENASGNGGPGAAAVHLIEEAGARVRLLNAQAGLLEAQAAVHLIEEAGARVRLLTARARLANAQAGVEEVKLAKLERRK